MSLLLEAMAVVLVVWALGVSVLVGIGALVIRAMDRDAVAPWSALWLGFAVAIGILQLWNLFLPVDWRAALLLGIVAAAGLRSSARALLAGAIGRARARPGLAVVLALATIWLSNRALGPPVGDAGRYHLQAVRWAAAYPVVPGLANLLGHFGFNNSSFLWSAMFELGPLQGRSSHFALGVLVVAFALAGVTALWRCLRGQDPPEPGDVCLAVALVPVIAHAITLLEMRISSPDPDTAAGLVTLAMAHHLVRVLWAQDGSTTVRTDLTTVCVLAALAPTLKLPTAPFSVAAVAVAWLAARRRLPPQKRLGIAGWTAAIAAALAVGWLVRGAVLTGYLLYPATAIPLSVDWAVPGADVAALRGAIRGAFMPPAAFALQAPGETWVRPWLVWQVTRCPELVLMPLVALVLLPWGVRDGRRQALWLLVPAAAALAFWMATAPHPRFAYAFAWAAAGAVVAATYPRARRARRLAGVILLLAVAFPPVHRIAGWSALRRYDFAAATLVLPPGPDAGFQPAPEAALVPRSTESSLVVYVPQNGDELWNGPLPATSHFRPDLRLRAAGDLGSGFTTSPGTTGTRP